jgi:hypothetical protein
MMAPSDAVTGIEVAIISEARKTPKISSQVV